ncbi:MAG TPA: hypothetical protein V6C81_21615 [Planktothrix sp.]|jgi:hypothetical protein
MARCKFDVVQDGGSFSNAFVNMPFTPGFHQGALRIGGGCGYSDPSIMNAIPGYVEEGLAGINCTVVSGGTMDIDAKFDSERQATVFNPKSFMITIIPALLKQKGFKIIAASTTPRTGQMELGEEFGTLFVSEKYAIDFRQDHAVVFQKDAMEIVDADWVADVLPFLKVHRGWQEKGVKSCWWGIEGGGGTRKEATWYLEHGIHCIITDGSGRQSDAMAKEFREGKLLVRNGAGDPVPVDPSLVTIVPFLDAKALNAALRAQGIIV